MWVKNLGKKCGHIYIWETCYEGQGAIVRTGHETTDLLKIVKEVWQAVYCHPVYWTYMQRKSYENAELDEL